MTDTTPKKNIQLIVVDVDHTLLDNKSKLSKRNEQALKTAIERGVKVMLATGKNFDSCKPFVQQLGLDTPGIYTQGLTIYNADGTLRHQQTLDPNIARRVITYAEERGFAVVAYAGGRLITRTLSPYVLELHTRWKETKPEAVGPLQNQLYNTPFNKLVLVSPGDPSKIKALRWQLNTQLNGSARLMSGGVPHMLEVLPPGASKGTALRAILKEMVIDPANVLAIGDGENDVEMIQLAGVGVAVANAEQTLKDAADHITLSNEENGVAEAVERFVIGKPEPKPEPTAESAATPASETPKPEDAAKSDDTPAPATPDTDNEEKSE